MSSLDPRQPFPGGDPRAMGANHTHRPRGKGNQPVRRTDYMLSSESGGSSMISTKKRSE